MLRLLKRMEKPAPEPDQEPLALSFPSEEGVRQIAFTLAVIALSAKLASVDGEVSSQEYASFRLLFPMPDAEAPKIAKLFKLAVEEGTTAQHYASQLVSLFAVRTPLFETLLDRLFKLAVSDLPLNPSEWQFLRSLSQSLGIAKERFDAIARPYRIRPEDPYAVLGITPSISDEELRQHYRKLIAKLHPDRLAASGLTPKQMEQAEAHAALINTSYDQIVKKRRWK